MPAPPAEQARVLEGRAEERSDAEQPESSRAEHHELTASAESTRFQLSNCKSVLTSPVFAVLLAVLIGLSAISCDDGTEEPPPDDTSDAIDASDEVDAPNDLDAFDVAEDLDAFDVAEDLDASDETDAPDETDSTDVDDLGDVPSGCELAGDPCDPVELHQGGYLCLAVGSVDSGTCLEPCDPVAVEEPCALGSFCVQVGDDVSVGACVLSDCGDFFRSDVDCVDAGSHGGNCMPFDNAVHLCVPAGSAAEGAVCSTDEEVGAELLCGPGLLCLGGLCSSPCSVAGDDCDPIYDGCIPLAEGWEMGVCEQTCDPFGSGECVDGTGCVPVTADLGVCRDVGTRTAGESCELDGPACAEGLLCRIDSGGLGQCLPYCDPLADSGEPGRCEDGSICLVTGEGDLGVCSATCDPWAAEPECEPGRGCYPNPDGSGACVDVGVAEAGETCEPPFDYLACAAGLLCVSRDGAPQGVCAPICLPYDDSRGNCAAEEGVCGTMDPWLGFCESSPLELLEGDICTTGNSWCAENLLCTRIPPDDGRCRSLCRLVLGDDDCRAGACTNLFPNDEELGVCVE